MTDISLPSDVSVWLASPEADFLKGRMIWVNWDVEELKAKKDEIIAKNQLGLVLAGVEGSLFDDN
jgi:hypothetical protein